MRRVVYSGGGFLLLVFAWTAASIVVSSAAQLPPPQWSVCAGDNPRLAIQACSELLAGGALSSANRVAAHINRGNAYDELGDSARALRDYDDALALDAGNAAAHRNKGVLFNRQGRLGDALREFDAVIQLEPSRGTNFANRAGVRFAQARLGSTNDSDRRRLNEQAIDDYDAALKLGGLGQLDTSVYSERGQAKYALNRFDEAILDFTKALELGADSGVTHLWRADANRASARVTAAESERASRYRRAQADYNDAIRLGGLGQAEPLAYFNRGFTQYYLGEVAASISDFTQAIGLAQNTPLLPYALLARAGAYADSGELDSATKDLQSASAFAGDPVVASAIEASRAYIATKAK